MKRRNLSRNRFWVWIIGATTFTWCYGFAMVTMSLQTPDDLPHALLVAVSGLAACMVGGYGALLVQDWVRKRRQP